MNLLLVFHKVGSSCSWSNVAQSRLTFLEAYLCCKFTFSGLDSIFKLVDFFLQVFADFVRLHLVLAQLFIGGCKIATHLKNYPTKGSMKTAFSTLFYLRWRHYVRTPPYCSCNPNPYVVQNVVQPTAALCSFNLQL